MNTRISFMHLENCLLLGRGALQTSIFDPRFNGLLSNIAHKDAPLIVLDVPIYRAGLSRLGWRGRAAAGGAYDQFLKPLFR
jgi:hypothetical protein